MVRLSMPVYLNELVGFFIRVDGLGILSLPFPYHQGDRMDLIVRIDLVDLPLTCDLGSTHHCLDKKRMAFFHNLPFEVTDDIQPLFLKGCKYHEFIHLGWKQEAPTTFTQSNH